jgi:uncharacterized membrane protein
VSDDDLDTGARAATRLTFFSDAVAAIAMTLLAIELPVPEGGTVHEFWTSVKDNDGHYAAFLISFVVIAAAWSDHHDLFRYAQGIDARVRLFNMGWLLSIVLNPFATKLLIVSHQTTATHALRFGFYALLQVLESATFYAMLRHLTIRRLACLPRPVADSLTWKSYGLMVGFGLSIPVFFATTYGWVLWIAAPFAAAQLRRRQDRALSSPDLLLLPGQLMCVLLVPVLPRVARIVAPPVHGDLGEAGVADEPDHRSVRVAGALAIVDGPLGEQRAALVDDLGPLGYGHDQLAAEGVDLQRDLAARQDGVGQVDDQRAEMRGQPDPPSGHPAPGADHLAEARRDVDMIHDPHAGVRGVLGGQVPGEQGEFAGGLRRVGGIQPLRVLGRGQPSAGQRAA